MLALSVLVSQLAVSGTLLLPGGSSTGAERARRQNRLASDLAVHTAAAGYCSYQLQLKARGQRCMVWALGFEVGVSAEQAYAGGASARGLFFGPSPVTFGSWTFRDEHHFTDVEVGFVEPFARLWLGESAESSGSSGFLGFMVGTRSWVGWGPLRLGVEVVYEYGPPMARGLAAGAFVGLAWHYAPLR